MRNFDDKLGVADAAIISGDNGFISKISHLLTDAEISFIDFRKSQLDNDVIQAQENLKNCVISSRNNKSRNHLLEARARMEWGLLRFTQGEIEEAGVDLKWAMERMKVLSLGSATHGISILNMAAWHVSRNENIMALALLSEIDRNGPFPLEIISSSRLQISQILFELGDFTSSQRHAWVSFQGFSSSDMLDEAYQSAIIWLDLSVGNVTNESQLMSTIVENSKPRDIGENHECQAHPDDVNEIIEWCTKYLNGDYSGGQRPDLLVLLDAEESIGSDTVRQSMLSVSNIEDSELIKLLGC